MHYFLWPYIPSQFFYVSFQKTFIRACKYVFKNRFQQNDCPNVGVYLSKDKIHICKILLSSLRIYITVEQKTSAENYLTYMQLSQIRCNLDQVQSFLILANNTIYCKQLPLYLYITIWLEGKSSFSLFFCILLSQLLSSSSSSRSTKNYFCDYHEYNNQQQHHHNER